MRRYRALWLLLAFAAWAADHKPPTASAISGSVLNAVTGEPVPKAQVALRSTSTNDSYTAVTDDTGNFAVAVDAPGAFEFVVQKRGFVKNGQSLSLTAGQSAAGAVIRLTPQGVIAGHVLDGSGEPIPEVSVQAIQSRQAGLSKRYFVAGSATTNDLGEYRIYGLAPGRYYVGGAYRSDSGYAAVFHPGVAEAARAVPIDVSAGGEVLGLNLTILETHSLRIRGVLQSAAGLNLQGTMIVAAPCDAGPLNRATTTIRTASGAFELRDLTPGCYILAADTFSAGRRYSARLPVNVAEANVEGVRLNLVPPVQLAGQVKVEGGGELQLPQITVNLEARFSKLTASGAPAENGSLLLNNIVPETYELNATIPDGFYLKSARFGESDVLQYGLDLSHPGDTRLELVVSGDGGRIDGSVTDDSDRPIPGARVALMPASAGNRSIRWETTTTDQEGAFCLRGIAPGNYKLYASQNLDVTVLQDPSYAERFEAKPLAIQERDRLTLSVKAMTVKTY
jgi:protocatechuate 3,4-dioxygenase beta subunit